jgi:nitrate reductase beta subunit
MIMELLHSATNAHVLHLQTRGYAAHVALGEYYTAIVGQVDALVEAIQGKYGIIKGYPMSNSFDQSMKPVAYLQHLHDMFARERSSLPKDSEISNLADTIAEQIDSTLYKLKFLK